MPSAAARFCKTRNVVVTHCCYPLAGLHGQLERDNRRLPTQPNPAVHQDCSSADYCPLQVYMGSWHETTVAIKILLVSTVVNNEREAEEALEASRKVGG